MCRMYTVFLIYKYSVTLQNIVWSKNAKVLIKQVLHLGKFLDKIKSEQWYRKLKRYAPYNLTIFTHSYLPFELRIPILDE